MHHWAANKCPESVGKRTFYHTIANSGALALCLDKAVIFQEPQMMGNGREAHVERTGDFRHACFPLLKQEAQDPDTRLVARKRKDARFVSKIVSEWIFHLLKGHISTFIVKQLLEYRVANSTKSCNCG